MKPSQGFAGPPRPAAREQTVRRLLLVDDEPDNLAVLETLLEDEYEVFTAPSGAAALEMIEQRREPFAVVVSDQRMPGMSGIELLAEVARRSPATVRMVLTGYVDIDPIVAAINEGSIYRFMLKPWDADEMRAGIADGVWLYHARMTLRSMLYELVCRRDDLESTVAELKRSEERLLAFERMSTLGRFTSGMAHNIRNSLTVMMNVLELLKESPAGPGVIPAAERAFGTLNSLLGIVTDVNSLARGELGRTLKTKVALGPFVQETIQELRDDDAAQGREVRRRIQGEVATFDTARVRQALIAILRTVALESAPGVALEITDARGPAGECIFEVRRLGGPAPGAAPPAVEALGFEIAREIAKAHGGRLVVSGLDGELTVQLTLADAMTGRTP